MVADPLAVESAREAGTRVVEVVPISSVHVQHTIAPSSTNCQEPATPRQNNSRAWMKDPRASRTCRTQAIMMNRKTTHPASAQKSSLPRRRRVLSGQTQTLTRHFHLRKHSAHLRRTLCKSSARLRTSRLVNRRVRTTWRETLISSPSISTTMTTTRMSETIMTATATLPWIPRQPNRPRVPGHRLSATVMNSIAKRLQALCLPPTTHQRHPGLPSTLAHRLSRHFLVVPSMAVHRRVRLAR